MYYHRSVHVTCYPVYKANYENVRQIFNALLSEYGVPQHLDIEGSEVQVLRDGNQQCQLQELQAEIQKLRSKILLVSNDTSGNLTKISTIDTNYQIIEVTIGRS